MDIDQQIIMGVNETLKNLMIDMIKRGEVEISFNKLSDYTYLNVKVKLSNKVPEGENKKGCSQSV